MRVVTGGAVRGRKRLIVMRLLQRRILHVVAIHAECGSSLSEVIIELRFANFSNFVSRMASVASHIERGMAASLLWDVESLLVAIEAEILAFVARLRLQ